MSPATIFVAISWLLASGAPRPGSVAFAQSASAQRASQPEAHPVTTAPASPPTAATKPCPAVTPSTAASPPDCKPAAKRHKRPRAAVTDPKAGPTKKVVHNGSTGDPDVDIAPGVSPQQASQQRETTSQLLVRTEENLKIMESRQLSPAQQDTVQQIRSYIKQSGDATSDGDVQRAYTLANKARMLSGDLVKH